MSTKPLFHVALVNETDHEIFYQETYPSKELAAERVSKGLEIQAMLNELGLGTCAKGKRWYAWGPSEAAFSWPEVTTNA